LTRLEIPIKSKYLSILFKTLNTLLFQGKLPYIAIIKKDLGDKFDGMYCYVDEGPVAIMINKYVRWDEIVHVLLHEMTHYYVQWVLKDKSPLEHSPAFVRVLTRVYRKAGLPPPSEDEIPND
jgi:hypothetical protein